MMDRTLLQNLPIFLALISIYSCKSLSNSFDERAILCATDVKQSNNQVKVYDFSGSQILGSDLVGLSLENDQSQGSIEFSRNGCFVPPASGEVYLRKIDFTQLGRVSVEDLKGKKSVYLSKNIATKLSPSEPIRDKRPYFSQDFLFVDAPYALNFYSENSLKNLDIEYCMDEIDPKIFDYSNRKCKSNFKLYFEDAPPKILHGFWRVIYKIPGQSTAEIIYFAVNNHCPGSFRDTSEISNKKCTSISNLTIDRNNSDFDLTNLNYLSQVEGALDLSNNKIDSLDGFNNLAKVGDLILSSNLLESIEELHLISILGRFELRGMPKVTSLDSLKDTEFSGGYVSISGLGIENIDFLKKIKNMNFGLTLNDLPVLKNIDGLSNLETISGHLEIKRNPQLKSLAPLKNLTEINHYLSLDTLPNLVNLDGLENLKRIGSNFALYNLNQVENFSFLKKIETIGGEISLHNLTNLRSFEGFERLVKLFSIGIVTAPALSTFNGLSNLSEITNGISLISTNHINFKGLDHLVKIGQNVSLYSCFRLEDFQGLEKITELNEINIDNGFSLKSFKGLENIKKINFIDFDKSLCTQSFIQSLSNANHPIAIWCGAP